ncbi:MAG: hypothetical protein K2W99_07945 [Chthoniobacterales bacterium]|nr:hypothetical protein [Chthoniobacterales bacterium]
MIQLTLAWFVFIYLVVFLAGILFFWIGYEMLRKRLASEDSRQLIYCRICGVALTASIASTTGSLLRCPHCGSLNEDHHQGGL